MTEFFKRSSKSGANLLVPLSRRTTSVPTFLTDTQIVGSSPESPRVREFFFFELELRTHKFHMEVPFHMDSQLQDAVISKFDADRPVRSSQFEFEQTKSQPKQCLYTTSSMWSIAGLRIRSGLNRRRRGRGPPLLFLIKMPVFNEL